MSSAFFSTRQDRTSPCACAEACSEKVPVSHEKSPTGVQASENNCVSLSRSLPPSSLEVNKPVSPEPRSPAKSLAGRPLTFHSILSPTPESPLREKKAEEEKAKVTEKDTPKDKSPSKLAGTTLSAPSPIPGLNVSPSMSIRRKILPHKRKLTRGMTCSTILFRPPPEIVVSCSTRPRFRLLCLMLIVAFHFSRCLYRSVYLCLFFSFFCVIVFILLFCCCCCNFPPFDSSELTRILFNSQHPCDCEADCGKNLNVGFLSDAIEMRFQTFRDDNLYCILHFRSSFGDID